MKKISPSNYKKDKLAKKKLKINLNQAFKNLSECPFLKACMRIPKSTETRLIFPYDRGYGTYRINYKLITKSNTTKRINRDDVENLLFALQESELWKPALLNPAVQCTLSFCVILTISLMLPFLFFILYKKISIFLIFLIWFISIILLIIVFAVISKSNRNGVYEKLLERGKELKEIMRVLNNKCFIEKYGARWSCDAYGSYLELNLSKKINSKRKNTEKKTEVENKDYENRSKVKSPQELEKIREANKKYLFRKNPYYEGLPPPQISERDNLYKDEEDSMNMSRKEKNGRGKGRRKKSKKNSIFDQSESKKRVRFS